LVAEDERSEVNVLLTGSSGFVGGHLGRKLQSLGHDVQFTRDPYSTHLPERPHDVLFHQAAITDPQSTGRGEMLRVNYNEAVRLFQRAIDAGVKRIVYASSAAVYGSGPCPQREDQPSRPLTCYAESKALLDVSTSLLSHQTGVPIVGLRYSNVYGPGEHAKGKAASVVYQLVQQMRKGHRPKIFEYGEQVRDWVSVRDVVQANVLAMGEVPSGVYNVGSGRATSFNEVVAVINNVFRFKLDPEYISNPFLGTYQDRTQLDLTKSTTVLGYKPAVGLAEGIRELLASVR
jgi:ADP-L-glycero-D-manno-heptose 6-epimerase